MQCTCIVKYILLIVTHLLSTGHRITLNEAHTESMLLSGAHLPFCGFTSIYTKCVNTLINFVTINNLHVFPTLNVVLSDPGYVTL